jgi:hypothetical protein
MKRGERGWDEETMCLVQYIACPMGEYTLAKKASLLPYDHGADGEGWSKSLLEGWGKSYGKGKEARSKFRRDRAYAFRIFEAVRDMPEVEGERISPAQALSPSKLAALFFTKPLPSSLRSPPPPLTPIPFPASPKFPSPLNKSFETVSTRCNGNDDDDGFGDDASSVSSLEEPYTQDHGNPTPPVSYGRKTERIKPGDTILYYDPVFRAGDKRGRRETIVLEVKGTDKTSKLVLANAAILSNSQPVCRVKTVHRGRTIPHPGVFRHVEEYVLRSARITPELEKSLGIEREGDRLKRIAKEGVEGFKKKFGGEGFFRNDGRPENGKNKTKGKTKMTKKRKSGEGEVDSDLDSISDLDSDSDDLEVPTRSSKKSKKADKKMKKKKKKKKKGEKKEEEEKKKKGRQSEVPSSQEENSQEKINSTFSPPCDAFSFPPPAALTFTRVTSKKKKKKVKSNA